MANFSETIDSTSTCTERKNVFSGRSLATEGSVVFDGVIPLTGEGLRLDIFLHDALHNKDVSREKIKRAIRQGLCTVEACLCKDVKKKLREGQRVILRMVVPASTLVPELGELEVLYKDEHLVVVNKGPGLTVHPCPSCPEGTLVHRLIGRFPELARQEGLRPGVVHRLDKDTSGLMVVALTEEARMRLSAAFAAREVRKEYVALVHGNPPVSGECRASLGRDPVTKVKMAVVEHGKPARSEWRVLLAQDSFALVQVRIHTGRTHQIRVHMAFKGYPLYGDVLYAPVAVAKAAPRQMLHARLLSFTHPFTKEVLTFTCPPPVDFLTTALRLRQSVQRVVVTGCPGCGKSTLVKNLAGKGIPVWSADTAVSALYEPEAAGWVALFQRFGERFVPDRKKAVDKSLLRAALKTEPGLRRIIEDLIHPLVREAMQRFWDVLNVETHPFAVAEIPLWFEGEWARRSDEAVLVVGVHCAQEVRQQRLMERRGWSEETVGAVDAWQWSDEDKMRACDFVVDNSQGEERMPCLAQEVTAWLAEQREQAEQDFCTQWTEQTHLM